jgi:hypothetical protein
MNRAVRRLWSMTQTNGAVRPSNVVPLRPGSSAEHDAAAERRNRFRSPWPEVRLTRDLIDRAEVVLDRVIGSHWPAAGHHDIAWALSGLLDALETYELAHEHVRFPGTSVTALAHGDIAWNRVLSRAALDASAWAGELNRLLPVHAEAGPAPAV